MTDIATLQALKFFLAAAISAVIVAEDIRRRRIANQHCAILLLIGAVAAALRGGWSGLADGLLGAVLGFVVFLIPYGIGGLGGGDVKLMAAFGALTGLHGAVVALLLSAIAGAGTAVVFLAWARLRQHADPQTIPYAPAIAAGSLLVAFSQIGVR